MEITLAIPTKNAKGLDDVVNEVFARSNYFTLIKVDLSSNSYSIVKIIRNEFTSLSYGVGPIVAKMLKDEGVDVIATPELGHGLRELINKLGLKYIIVNPNVRLNTIMNEVINHLKRLYGGPAGI